MKFLKFAFLLGVLGFFFTGCLGDSGRDNVAYGFLATTKIEDKEIKPAGEESTFTITYKTTNTCQAFVQFQLSKSENKVMELGVVGSQRSGDGCTNKEEEKTQEFRLPSTLSPGTYTLKFWAGKDANNTDKFLEHQVEIKEKAAQ